MAWPAVCATFLLFYTIINPQLFVLSVYVCSLSLFSDMFFTRSSKHLSTAHETTSDDGLALIELKKKVVLVTSTVPGPWPCGHRKGLAAWLGSDLRTNRIQEIATLQLQAGPSCLLLL